MRLSLRSRYIAWAYLKLANVYYYNIDYILNMDNFALSTLPTKSTGNREGSAIRKIFRHLQSTPTFSQGYDNGSSVTQTLNTEFVTNLKYIKFAQSTFQKCWTGGYHRINDVVILVALFTELIFYLTETEGLHR